MPLVLEEYQRALLAFLGSIHAVDAPKWLVGAHIRFPASSHSPLAGSDFGREVWQSPEAERLTSVLLADENLNRWLAPPPESRIYELRAHIASLILAWNERGGTPEQIVRECSEEFLDVVRDPSPGGGWMRILYGVNIDKRLELPHDTALQPISYEEIRELLAGSGGNEIDALRIPRQAALAAYASAKCNREDMRGFAASTASGMAYVMIERLRCHIWLATGVLPHRGDSFSLPLSAFPILPSLRQPAGLEEMHYSPQAHRPSPRIEPALLFEIDERMAPLYGHYEQFPEGITAPLWVAQTFMTPAIDTPDSLVTLLFAYAAIEGLLLKRDDDDSQLGSRLAILVRRDAYEGRRIRRILKRWRDIRGFAAHGTRPPIEAVTAFLEESASPEEMDASWLGMERTRAATQERAARLLRRAFLGLLWCCVALQDGVAHPALERDHVITLLAKAAGGNSGAIGEIRRRVPAMVREIGL